MPGWPCQMIVYLWAYFRERKSGNESNIFAAVMEENCA
jgi:hypothetical protein